MIATLRHRAAAGRSVVTAAALGLSLGLWPVGVLKLLDPGPLASPPCTRRMAGSMSWSRTSASGLYLRVPIVDPVAAAADAQGVGSPLAAAAGLRGFTDMLVARLVILVIGIALTFVVRDSVAGIKVVLTGGTLLGMALGLAMVTGLLRFAGASPAGGGPARVAAAMLGVGLLLDAWTLKLVSDLFGTRLGAAFGGGMPCPGPRASARSSGSSPCSASSRRGATSRSWRGRCPGLAGGRPARRRAGRRRPRLRAAPVASGRRPNVALLLRLAVAVLVGALVMIVGVVRLRPCGGRPPRPTRRALSRRSRRR
ncbi:MAG: hypothetical protein R3F43_23685 [bacterium]